jgi:hypothetical protein
MRQHGTRLLGGFITTLDILANSNADYQTKTDACLLSNSQTKSLFEIS